MYLNEKDKHCFPELQIMNGSLPQQNEVVQKCNENISLRSDTKIISRQSFNDLTINSCNFPQRIITRKELESCDSTLKSNPSQRNEFLFTPSNYTLQSKMIDQSTPKVSPLQKQFNIILNKNDAQNNEEFLIQ